MFSQISSSYIQKLLCKKRERIYFDCPYPMAYSNNIIQHNFQNNIKENENNNYYCKDGCNITFKSLQKKIAHHNRLDDNCYKEKNNLFILLSEFQNCIFKLNENNQFDNSNQYLDVQKQFKKTKNSVFDKNQWNNFLN